MIVGIVGSEAAKFTAETEQKAKQLIASILMESLVTGFSSGHCHLGGVDIWTEEIGSSLLLKPFIYSPMSLNWIGGFKERNMQIAVKSDVVHCITVRTLPGHYTGMRFESCYHCKTKDHVKSGGCWTIKYAAKLGKKTQLHIID